MITSRLFSAGLVLTILSCACVSGQDTKPGSTQQLYLLAGTSTPSYSTELFPANLYQVSTGSKLKLIREVILQKNGFIGVYAAGDVLFLPNLEGAVSIIHTNNPGLVDDVVFDTQHLIPLYAPIVAAEPPGMPADLLIPLAEPPSDPPTPLKGKLVSVSSEPNGGASRIRFDAWDEYNAARIEGPPGGPVLAPDDFWGTAVGDDFAISLFGHSIPVDALPPPLRGEKDKFFISAASQQYVLLGRFRPRAEEYSQKPVDLFVHDRRRDVWKTIQSEGSRKLFGPWLATRVTVLLRNPKPSPGRENERNYGTISLPNVRDEYDNSPYHFWRSGTQVLENLEDGRKIRIETNQEDSEILSVTRDTVLYRVNDVIYQAKIADDKLQNASVVVKDEDVPEIHWVFWGPPVKAAAAVGSAVPSGRPAHLELNEQGLDLMKQGDYKNASVKFLEATTIEPKNAMYANNAGFAFYKMGDYENAVNYLKTAIALDPKRAIAYLNLGDAYVKFNQVAEALQAYAKYLELAPDSKSAPDVKQKLGALPTFGLAVPQTGSQTSQSSAQTLAAADSRWAVQFADESGDSFKRTECHSLPYFQTNLKQIDMQAFKPAGDHSFVRHVGSINGFAVYDVIHQFTDGEPPDARSFNLKIILVEHKPGEFCEIYLDRGDTGGITIAPSYIEHFGSDSVLVSRDSVTGNGGNVSQAYWTFDQAGPIPIDFFELIIGTLHKLIPGATDDYASMGFNIHDMVYDNAVWKEGDGHAGPSGGHITIRFRLKDHRPVVVSTEVRPN